MPLGKSALIVTTSEEPVLPDDIPEDAFVAAIGSFRPNIAELPEGLIQKSTIVVDDLAGAREEAGDLIRAGRALNWDEVLLLEEALDAGRLGGPVVFESVGHALWDLAAARLALGPT